MTPTITIFPALDGSCWMGDFSQASDADEIRRLFETTEIPLPWCASAPAERVIASLQAQPSNAGYAIRVRGTR